MKIISIGGPSSIELLVPELGTATVELATLYEVPDEIVELIEAKVPQMVLYGGAVVAIPLEFTPITTVVAEEEVEPTHEEVEPAVEKVEEPNVLNGPE